MKLREDFKMDSAADGMKDLSSTCNHGTVTSTCSPASEEAETVGISNNKHANLADTPNSEVSPQTSITDGSVSSLSPASSATEQPIVNYEGSHNGHLSPSSCSSETVTNGVVSGMNSPTPLGPSFVPMPAVVGSPGHVHTQSAAGSTGSQGSHGQRGQSPQRYSPNAQSSRGNSPQNQSPAGGPNQQHVVHVHVNPGETFSVRVGDQIQHIQGPATVRMVSNNGPPLPMPMQVPPGHMVQQIVDENGILTHVILSPQPTGMAGAPMTTGPNGSPQQMYPSYSPQYAPYPAQYAPHHHPHHGAAPHVHAVPATHIHGTPPPHQCSSHSHPHVHSTGPVPAHHNHSPVEDRPQCKKPRLKGKWKKQTEGFYQSHIQDSPHRSKPKMNGDVRQSEQESSSSSAEGQDLEEERRVLRKLLSSVTVPKVSEVDARSALIQIGPPDWNSQQFNIQASEFTYELLLSEKGREGKYKAVYTGDATEITLKDLKPAAEYHLKVSCILDDLRGESTSPVSFKTQGCEPDQPQPPKPGNRTKTSLQLKWSSVSDNGAKITSYILEYDQGRGDKNFVQVYSGQTRQFKVVKLSASTGYTFRLAAINSFGTSEYSDAVCYFTSGSAPSQPDPPMLSECFVKALLISWIKRPNDEEFTLQMEDEATGHGFLTVYNGSDLSYKIKNLRRNTEYKYKLQASNEEGSSRWSDTVCYRTLPDCPTPPPKPQLKGRVHAHNFRLIWDPPKDTGGSEITKYRLELDDGRGYKVMFEGSEREFTCDQLHPGHDYRVHVCCYSAGGQSQWSDAMTVSTLSVAPGPCLPPKLTGKPKASSLHLRWNYPDYNGGAQVKDFECQMTGPDNKSQEVYRGPDTECLVAGLLPGRPYLFQVRASNKTGAGPWSDICEVVSGAGVPDPPKIPLVQCRSAHSAVVSWEVPVNNGATITDYRLEQQLGSDTEFSQLYFGSALSYEVRGLTAATLYHFRVQALNSAGAGPFSAAASCVTPSSSPGPVLLTSLRASATANSIHLTWREPNCNGSEVISYNIDIGEKHLISVGNVLDYVIEDLTPETSYKMRVQAVNAIGVGAFSSALRVMTKTLPPCPPRLECVTTGPNSLKLKWGDGKNPDMIQYELEMLRDTGSFHPIYHGTSHTHKISKLSELTSYDFRIYACNQAGDGPYSNVCSFKTTKAPPPAVKSPTIFKKTRDSCTVEWTACKAMGRDNIVYCLQLQHREGDQEAKQVFRGSDTSHQLKQLVPNTEYQVRVCAVRQCVDDGDELIGAYSQWKDFTTDSPEPAQTPSTSSNSPSSERRQLTDQHWAIIILLGFAIIAILIAFLAHKIIANTKASTALPDLPADSTP